MTIPLEIIYRSLEKFINVKKDYLMILCDLVSKNIDSTFVKIAEEETFKHRIYNQYPYYFLKTCQTTFKMPKGVLNDFLGMTLDNKEDFIKNSQKVNKSFYKRIKQCFSFKDKIENNDLLKETLTIKKNIIALKKKIMTAEETPSHKTMSTMSTTITIEAIPKILQKEGDRPKDKKEAAIYDLRCLYGFGPAHARKFFEEEGITLEKLLQEWKAFVNKEGNDILMLSKLPLPSTLQQNLTGKSEMNERKLKTLRYKYLMERIYEGGFMSLSKCNLEQLVGIKHFEDIAQKIPRAEIIKMETYLKTIVQQMNKDFILTCCGSYRRGRDRSGDMDCLLTHKLLLTKTECEAFEAEKGSPLKLLKLILTDLGFLTDHLTDNEKTKYMGLCKLPNNKYTIQRRIDIRFVPYHSYGAALLYFTGSQNFNTEMRKIAIDKGYTLNEYGLFKTVYDPKTKKKNKGDQIPTITEKDIFDQLDMEYKTPKERDI